MRQRGAVTLKIELLTFNFEKKKKKGQTNWVSWLGCECKVAFVQGRHEHAPTGILQDRCGPIDDFVANI